MLNNSESINNNLDDQAVKLHATAIISGMAEMSVRDVIRVLNTAIELAVSQPAGNELNKSFPPPEFRLIRKGRGTVSKISQDIEMQGYINSIEKYVSLDDLRRDLIKTFGETRAPSRSALHRWIDKRTKQSRSDL